MFNNIYIYLGELYLYVFISSKHSSVLQTSHVAPVVVSIYTCGVFVKQNGEFAVHITAPERHGREEAFQIFSNIGKLI